MATIEYFDAKQLFNEGKAAMFGTGQWDCAEFDKNVGEHIGFWWGPKFGDSSYEQNIAMKVPAAPLVVSSAVKDNDKAKEALYAFLKYYYGEEAAKISYEGSIFPATNYDGIAATDSQYAMNAMITALGNGWETPKAARTRQLLRQFRKQCMMQYLVLCKEHTVRRCFKKYGFGSNKLDRR